MTVKKMTRIVDRFQRETLLKATDLDQESNDIVKYINDELLTIINKIKKNIIPHSTALQNRGLFLFNVGDGTLKWAKILDEELLEDFSLDWNDLDLGSVSDFSMLILDKDDQLKTEKIQISDINNIQYIGSKDNELVTLDLAKAVNMEYHHDLLTNSRGLIKDSHMDKNYEERLINFLQKNNE